MLFQRAGIATENKYFLGLFKWHSLIDKTWTNVVGRDNQIKAVCEKAWPHAMKGFIGENQYLELYPETY